MKEPETYCICKCPRCGLVFHEWIELYTQSTINALCWCPSCQSGVYARCIPAEMNYAW